MKDKICERCNKKLKSVHSNVKRCAPCRDYLKLYVPTTMTPLQIAKAEKMIGKYTRHQICERLGVSLSSLKRAFRGTRMPCVREHINKIMASNVSAYYQIHGLKKTEEKFPELRIRSIIERYKLHSPRQAKWKNDELVEVVRMSHFASHSSQAKYLNRPGAKAGSILSVHSKRLFKGIEKGNIHGLYEHKARFFVTKSCPKIIVNGLVRTSGNNRYLYLWSDMEKNIRIDCPAAIKDAISAGATFQRWLYKTENPRKEILKIIRERGT